MPTPNALWHKTIGFGCCSVIRTRGYTLLELLVVLLLLGLVAGLAAPKIMSLYDSVQRALDQDQVLQGLGGLGYQVYQRAKPAILRAYPPPSEQPADEQPPLVLPVGWTLAVEAPIHFFANGACSGGVAHLSSPGKAFTVLLSPPTCAPQIVALPAE